MWMNIKNNAKWKKIDTFYDSIYVKFYKEQNCINGK